MTTIGSIWKDGAQSMLAQFTEWRRTEADSRSGQLADAKQRLATIDSRLSRLLDVYIDGTVDHDDYARKKDELLREKTVAKEAIGRIQSAGNAWLEPMADFLKDAIQAETIALTGTPEELIGFHRRIGSNLSLIEPDRPEDAADPQTRASKERAATSAARHGGFAARASLGPASLPPSSRMPKAGSWSGERSVSAGLRRDKSAAVSEVASPAVTSDAADVSAASVVSLARVAGNLKWSERQDSNLRHPAPKAGALARLSYAPNHRGLNHDGASPRNDYLRGAQPPRPASSRSRGQACRR